MNSGESYHGAPMIKKAQFCALKRCLVMWTRPIRIKLINFLALTCAISGIAQDDPSARGIETWKFNLLHGEILVVDGGLVKTGKERALKVEIGEGKSADALLCEFKISKIVYAEPTIMCIADFADCKDHFEKKISVNVYYLGSKEELDGEATGWFVISYDLFGRLYLFPSHQLLDRHSLKPLLNQRNEIRDSWKRVFLPPGQP